MRKTIKRMRALARLLHYELGEQELAAINSSLRGAGQRLAGERDAEVRLGTLESLRARHPRRLALEGIEQLCKRLEHEREQAIRPAYEHELLDDIANMRGILSSWRLLDPDFEATTPGLRRIYSEGRSRYAHVRGKHVSNNEAHDWRKRVKALYYALDMLGGANRGRMRGTTKRAERLGDMLGEEHDLWMLAAYINDHTDAFGDDGDARKALLKAIRRRGKRLRKRALKLGARLYEDHPSDFVRRAGERLRD